MERADVSSTSRMFWCGFTAKVDDGLGQGGGAAVLACGRRQGGPLFGLIQESHFHQDPGGAGFTQDVQGGATLADAPAGAGAQGVAQPVVDQAGGGAGADGGGADPVGGP